MIKHTGIRKKSISVLFAAFYTRDACMVIDGIFSYLINEKHDSNNDCNNQSQNVKKLLAVIGDSCLI